MPSQEVYVHRAAELFKAAEELKASNERPNAVALLSIHSAIALSDALLIRLTGKRSKSEDHRRASEHLDSACRSQKIDAQSLKHLRTLIARKSDVSYGDQATSPALADSLFISGRRFREWGNTILQPGRRTS